MVALSIVDADRQWFKARIGIDDKETPRDVAFCAHTICDDEPLVVPDATIDPRFCKNRLVTDGPRIRSYAGVQLFAPAGVNVGTLCIIDIVPRVFLDSELLVLRQLGDLTNSMLTKHKMAHENAKSAKALANQVRLFDRACELAKMGAWELDSKTDSLLWTDSMYDLHDVKTGTEIKLDEHLSCYLPSDRVRLESLMSSSRSTNEAFTFEGRMYTAKGDMKWVRVSSDVDVENGVPIRRFGMKQDLNTRSWLIAWRAWRSMMILRAF
jgi:PAS domain-containing protein